MTRLLRIFAALMLSVPTAAYAALPPFPAKTVTITARNQSVANVINDLFGQAGLRVKVSSAVNGKMNGTFTATPAEIWNQLSRAYNLVGYYDGAVVRVYAASEIQTRSFASTAPQTVVRNAQQLRLIDNSNIILASGNAVTATGIPEFLSRVAQLAGSTTAPIVAATTAATSPVIRNTTPGSVPVISPMLNGPATLATVRSSVISAASTRSPYEVRIFYLRYARADDTIQKSFDRTDVIPGVGSILMGVMGDGRTSRTVSTSGNFDIARQSLPRLLGRGLGSVPPDASQRDYDDDEGGRGGGSSGPVRQNAGRDLNGPHVEVDATNNAVIVRDRPESMKVYEDIVRALDVEPRQIEVEATILELDTTRLKELGIDFSIADHGLNALFGGQQTNPTSGFSPGNIGASLLTGALNGFNLRITALEKSGALRIVSRPRMSTLNNIPVVFNNQVTYYARVAGDRQVDLFPITAGLIMRVNPSVLYDGGELRTRMAIDIVDGSPSGLVVDGIPAVKQSSINTNAVVKQGESLLIGGMTIDTEYDYKSKIPVAGDVPLLGQLFRKRSKGGQHFERLFLITARILSQTRGTAAAVTPSSVIPLEQLQAMTSRRRGSR